MKEQLLNRLKRHGLITFFITSIVWLELVFRLWIWKGIGPDFLFPVLFALPAGAVLFFVCGLCPVKIGRITAVVLTILLTVGYEVQLIYHCIFQTPLSLYSLTGAEDAAQFKDVVADTLLQNAVAVVLLLVPLAFLLIRNRKVTVIRLKLRSLYKTLAFCAASHILAILCLNLTGTGAVSPRTLYYTPSSAELAASKLGLLTTMRLDLERLAFGVGQNEGETDPVFAEGKGSAAAGTAGMEVTDPAAASIPEATSEGTDPQSGEGSMPEVTSTPEQSAGTEASPAPVENGLSEENVMKIDFDALIAGEKDATLLRMHKYFSAVKPTKKNEYTGLFKGCNLILITAEGFSPYAVSPELTPTLYSMIHEGFYFKNFYNPIWDVSTSDGEYVACTGLIPKSGIWSFARSGSNDMPFVMGNQFKKLGYTTKAYHNHTYTYYKRHLSHPNMGYDYKGVGNGLNIKKTWPESDLEMIDVTVPEYVGSQPFHTYYMTVSGHLQYNFGGNQIAKKNKSYVADLPYSNSAKAYIACNLELEFAMKALLEKLEAAGIADKTVIALSPDHYPYGLPRECIDELAGHKVEDNFELFKSVFILWKKGMTPVEVEKPCASLDITPTLSNLFALEFDSRLLMGRDILSDAPPLVIFSNRSWITDRARFNALANSVTFTDGTEKDKAYVESIHKTVGNKFAYSAKILEKDYYRMIMNKQNPGIPSK